MKRKLRHRGSTLTEMTVVIAAIVLLVGLAVPAIRAMLHSFESSGGAKSMISAALASARAIAAKERRYAGVRFQKAYDPEGPLKAAQYMVLIVHDYDKTGLASGFRAVEGLEPMKLPDTVGVMDLMVVQRVYLGPVNLQLTHQVINTDGLINNHRNLMDTTSFAIVFSPSGKLVIHDVQVRNRDGIPDSMGRLNDVSYDDVFNKKVQVEAGLAMFYQDDYFNAWWSAHPGLDLGLGPEQSRRSFVIYERDKFRQALQKGQPYSGYLASLVPDTIYINPYTGTMIEK